MIAEYDPVTLEVLWARLISLVDEAAATFVRTSFSTLVRESNDFAVVLTDADGGNVAQYSGSLPSFLCTLSGSVRAFMGKFPRETMWEGDVILTNDPWLGTGHVHDISLAMPVFHGGAVIGFTAIATHLPDIGGRLRSSGIREIYEEGLQIPIMHLIRAGQTNDTLLEIIRQNVRVPDQTIGDIYAAVAACTSLGVRLNELIQDERLDFGRFGRVIQKRTEDSLRAAIRAMPDGTYRNVMTYDGLEERVTIDCKVHVTGDALAIDYAGTSPQLARSVNVVPAYTYAYSAYGVKVLLAPDMPNNEGGFRPIAVSAPPGTCLNPRYPAPTGARNLLGHMLPVAVMGAMADFAGKHRGAEGSANSSFQLSGQHAGRQYSIVSFINAGQGATALRHGMSALSFPSNLANTPIEIIENLAPIRVLRRGLRCGSGGIGERRGGDGIHLRFAFTGDTPAVCSFIVNRMGVPPAGLDGGHPGQTAVLRQNGRDIDQSVHATLRDGDIIDIMTAGGGGFGVPA